MIDRDSESQQILLVEDSLDQANLLRRWLESAADYQVTTVQDGVRGSSLAQERRWALIITDINLPGSDGIEVIRASKAMHPETPVLAMTAYQDQSYSARALKEGADGFLHKPLTHPQLLERVRDLLRTGGSLQSAHGPTVLAIGAHPDDVEAGCGGTLLRHLDRGDRVVILVLAAGTGADEDRLGEAELAARLMGCRAMFADLSAEELTAGDAAAGAVARVAEAFDPTVLYVPSAHDDRESRRHAHRAGMLGCPDVPTVLAYQTTTSTVEFAPARFVEVSEYIKRKKEILALFHTAERTRPHLTPAFVEASAIYWSRFAGYRRVEPLEEVRSAVVGREATQSAFAHDPANVAEVAG